MRVTQKCHNRQKASWSDLYGERHRQQRITEFPPGIEPPQKVRLYARAEHYILQVWDPKTKRTVSERVDGDFLSALIRARELDNRVLQFRRSGIAQAKLPHQELVTAFLTYQQQRADAEEIEPDTVDRYRTALQHYLRFAEFTESKARWPNVQRVDEDFVLGFAAHLATAQVSPNGHVNTPRRALVSSQYVMSIVRMLYCWATEFSDSLLSDSFRNPFKRRVRNSKSVNRDLFGEPDITIPMAVAFLNECEAASLPWFGLLVCYGLRPSELCYLFCEHLQDDWLNAVCLPEIGYVSKGRRDKRLPLIGVTRELLQPNPSTCGLLFHKPIERLAPQPASLRQLADIYQLKCGSEEKTDARQRQDIRLAILQEAGALRYDDIEHAFRRTASRLKWPREATLKDFRHLFNTSMQNSGMPECYRKYLLGQSPGRSAIVNYTHLNDVRQQYERAINNVYQPILDALSCRLT